MKKMLIILAGYPATGKTYIIEQLNKEFEDLNSISVDEIEEKKYDKYGFKNQIQKKNLYNESFNEFYKKLDNLMANSKNVAIDYPFSYLQYHKLKKLCEKYSYTPLTIRLTGDINVIYKRRVKRDLDPCRHPGHLLSSYQLGMDVPEDLREENLITLEEFKKHCELREYDSFKLGELLEIDVTEEYANVKKIINWIKKNSR